MINRITLCLFLLVVSCAQKQRIKPARKKPERKTDIAYTYDNSNHTPVHPPVQWQQTDSDAVQLPGNHQMLDKQFDDLNNDGVPECFVAYEKTPGQGEEDVRGLKIFRRENGKWKQWYDAVGPVLTFDQVMLIGGDPFKGIDIERNTIVVHHYGVGYSFTHRYRCNAGCWEVIGATVIYETRMVDQDKTDFNLMTGKIEYAHSYFYPDEEEGEENFSATYLYKLKKLPEMNGFVPTHNEAKIPGSGGVTITY